MDELEDAVGPEAAQRAAEGYETPSGRPRPLLAEIWSSRLLVAIFGAAAVVFGAFLSILTGSWWLLAAALLVHAAGTVLVVWLVFRVLGDVESPSPTAAAALEARGVRDPDGELNALVARTRGGDDGRVRRLLRDDVGELPEPERDPAASARGQQAAWTPSGGRSRPVGPRGDAA